VLCRLVNLFFGTRFTDLSCAYNAYWRELLPALVLPAPDTRGPKRGRLAWGEGPEIDTLTTLRMATQGLRVVEVATIGYPRIYGEERPRRLLPAALRALRTAWAEYVRRWRIGRRPAPQRHEAPREQRRYEAPRPREAAYDDEPTGRHAARHSVPPPGRDRETRSRDSRRFERRRGADPGRPDLTVIRGEGRDERWESRSHLRAVPGENFRRD
jgi:hypothetical protein